MTTCLIDGCENPVFVKSRGWCRTHYHRWYRTGDPLTTKYVRASGTPLERWWSKVEKQPDDGCWLWMAGKDHRGYGQFTVNHDGGRQTHRAYRWGYQQLVRPLAPGETLDHLCRTPACVRPDHLEPVAHLVNVQRGEAGKHNAVKTHCKQGHEFTPENTILRPSGRGCRECSRKASREAQRRRRGFEGWQPNGVKTHCKRGHAFTAENTVIRPDGSRTCKECGRGRSRAYAANKRARPN